MQSRPINFCVTPAEVVARIAAMPLWVYCLAAVALFAAFGLRCDPAILATSLGDTDDATRLAQVRDFLAGGGWFDTTLNRFGGSAPLVSHWSRLIDLPIATLITLFGAVMNPSDAETAARAVWPLILLFGLFLALAKATDEWGGRAAVVIMLVLALASFSATVQFKIGRIDHHNAQILFAIGGILLLARGFNTDRLGFAGGALLGLGSVIGYEALPLTIAALAVVCLWAVWTGRGAGNAKNGAAGFVTALAVGLVTTKSPSQWLGTSCDALSANLVVLAAVVCPAVTFALSRPQWPATWRLATMAAAGAAGLAIYGAMEPACLAGPFGQVDPALRPIWLDKVFEARSMVWFAATMPVLAAVYLFNIVAGGIAGAALARSKPSDATSYCSLIFVIAAALSVWQIKLMSYAAILSLPLIAAAISRIQGNANVSDATLRATIVAAINQTTMLIVCASLFTPVVTDKFADDRNSADSCTATSALSALADLPPGLAVSDIDIGPYLVALTSLDAYVAPYHRLDRQIIATDRMLYGDIADARRLLEDSGARYVVSCAGMGGKPDGTLKAALATGKAPEYLEPVALTRTSPLAVWRIRTAPVAP